MRQLSRSRHSYHGRQYGKGRLKILRSEKDPRDVHGQERHEPARCFRQALPRFSPQVIDADVHAVQTAPEDEGPSRPVPQTGQQHGDEDVPQVVPCAISTEGNVQVIFQKRGERHVPPPPEFDDAR